MVAKKYTSPVLGLNPGEDPIDDLSYSQGTSGNISPWSFEGISDYDLDMIDMWCDDFDLKEMDANGDFVITAEEFQAWLEARGGWD